MASIVAFDSDYDDVVRPVTEFRRTNIYPILQDVDIHQQNLASRGHIVQALRDASVVFLTGSGHGLDELILGHDRSPVWEVGHYATEEVAGKIVHLLACRTANELGVDMIQRNCQAFFGYDVDFIYHLDHLEAFMAPDVVIDRGIAEGKTAREIHEACMAEYQKQIDLLEANGNIDVSIIIDMMSNRDHLCTPVKHPKWGSPQARLPNSII